MISAFGLCVLLSHREGFEGTWRGRRFALIILALLLLNENIAQPMKLEATIVVNASTAQRTLANGATEIGPRLVIGTSDHYPVDTLLILLLWVWCGAKLLRECSRVRSEAEA